jgi:hypothetical protein
VGATHAVWVAIALPRPVEAALPSPEPSHQPPSQEGEGVDGSISPRRRRPPRRYTRQGDSQWTYEHAFGRNASNAASSGPGMIAVLYTTTRSVIAAPSRREVSGTATTIL